MMILSALFFITQLITLVGRYLSGPKNMDLELTTSSASFPDISVCNMRNLDVIILNRLNSIFRNNSDPVDYKPDDPSPFINAYMEKVAKYSHMYYAYQQDYMQVLQSVLSRVMMATNLNRADTIQAGVSIKDLVVSCSMSRKSCNISQDFEHFFNPYYYNCYTYQSDHGIKWVSEGLDNGWSAIVLSGSGLVDKNDFVSVMPGTHERMSPQSGSEGVRVVVHPPGTQPYPDTEGFDVPPGFSASFAVKPQMIKRLAHPYGSCDTTAASRTITCQKKCMQQHVVERCGCKDITLPGEENFPNKAYCTDDSIVPEDCKGSTSEECLHNILQLYEQLQCVQKVKSEVDGYDHQTCACSPPCEDVSYDVTYSLSKWPSEGFDGDEAYLDIIGTSGFLHQYPDGSEKEKLYSRYFVETNRHVTMTNFARLNVYLADSDMKVTKEVVAYSKAQLLSDICSQLGLWLVVFVVSLAESIGAILHTQIKNKNKSDVL